MAESQNPGVATFAVEDPRQPDLKVLVEELDAEMKAAYAENSCWLASVEELAEDYVQFLVARYHGHPIACGALVIKDIDWAEIKRMYVRPVARGKGLSRVILDNLVDMARRRDLKVVKLETGEKLEAAVHLYRSAGFVECEPFEGYQDAETPESLFMEMRLGA